MVILFNDDSLNNPCLEFKFLEACYERTKAADQEHHFLSWSCKWTKYKESEVLFKDQVNTGAI